VELEGSETLAASREQVWQALFDRAVIERSIPGCRDIGTDERHGVHRGGKAESRSGVGTLQGQVELSDIEPFSPTLSGKGSGGIAGFAEGFGAGNSYTAGRRDTAHLPGRCCGRG
jgi:carbon monoxide dehydrogenase subunit G